MTLNDKKIKEIIRMILLGFSYNEICIKRHHSKTTITQCSKLIDQLTPQEIEDIKNNSSKTKIPRITKDRRILPIQPGMDDSFSQQKELDGSKQVNELALYHIKDDFDQLLLLIKYLLELQKQIYYKLEQQERENELQNLKQEIKKIIEVNFQNQITKVETKLQILNQNWENLQRLKEFKNQLDQKKSADIKAFMKGIKKIDFTPIFK